LENHLKLKPIKAKNKITRHRSSKALQLTGVQIIKEQIQEIMIQDKQFRNQCIDIEMKL